MSLQDDFDDQFVLLRAARVIMTSTTITPHTCQNVYFTFNKFERMASIWSFDELRRQHLELLKANAEKEVRKQEEEKIQMEKENCSLKGKKAKKKSKKSPKSSPKSCEEAQP